MATDLKPVEKSLADLTRAELRALIAATHATPQIAPGVLAWIESACDWELNQRSGISFPLQPPAAAIPPDEEAAGIDAVMELRAMLAEGDHAVVVGLLDTIVKLLAGGQLKH